MLTKALINYRKQLATVSARSVHTYEGKNYCSPEGLKDVVNHLDEVRPTYTLLYFHAKWNPTCKAIDKDYENFTNKNNQFYHMKVDCDETPVVKRYFDARVEPMFLLLIKGGEIARMTGFNFHKLQTLCDKATNLHEKEFAYHFGTKDTWERFYDEYDRFARSGEVDRDSFRAHYDVVADTHRGPGSI